MSRWQPGARERLERAALELFVEQGFAATTVPGITARAGLTTRTFFRHYADKREVLFAGDDAPALAARLIAEAPAAMDPMTLITEGLRAIRCAKTSWTSHPSHSDGVAHWSDDRFPRSSARTCRSACTIGQTSDI